MAAAVFRGSAVCLSRASIWHVSNRFVSTLSPLESVFNRLDHKLEFSFSRENVGLFRIPELKDYTGFYLLQQNVLFEAEDLVSEATSTNRNRKLVEIFDQLSDCLCRVADMADFIRIAHPDEKYAQAAEETCISISGLVEKMNTNTAIHGALQNVIQNGDTMHTDAVDQRVAELFMFDFEQSGIHLSQETREEFVKLNEAILQLGTYFMSGTLKPVRVNKTSLPTYVKQMFPSEGETLIINSMCSDNHNVLIRETAYKLYLHPDQHQIELLEVLLNTRDRLAKLVGFHSYGHRALRGTMGDSPENVRNFLESVAEDVQPKAEAEFKLLQEMKKKHVGSDEPIRPWDLSYYSGLARHELCEVNSLELSPYFSLGTCMCGLSNLIEQLFGVQLHHEKPAYGEVWSHDVQKLAVIHETEGLLGHIYCDFFERRGKPGTDCHFTIRGGRMKEDGTYQNPIVVLMLNFPPPRGNFPSLLTPGMLENLFHEFGHAMHSMLGRTRYQHVTGTRCPTDFAEVPSILMEYFADDPRVIGSFARHWQTGEKLSEDKIRKLCTAKRMFGASETQLQVFYSILDQEFHGVHPLQGSTIDILERLQNKYYQLPYVPGTAWHQRFGHFVGYGAKYYSYLMSHAVSASIWHAFFKEQPYNRQNGERYRQKMLAHGGATHPAELVEDMIGVKPTAKMLAKSLIADLHH